MPTQRKLKILYLPHPPHMHRPWMTDVRDALSEHEFRVYPGAGHAFSAPVPPLRHDEADVASWADALAFLRRHGAG